MKILVRTSLFLSALLALAVVPVSAQSRMQVSAGSTPIHTQPSDGSPQIGQANAGEILFVARVEGDWAAISPPDRFDLWLNQDFIEGNRVIAKNIPVRAGPGVQYDIVCTLERGAPVMPRGESGDWRKIAPPSSATLWVRKKDLSEVRAQTTPIQQVATVPEPAKPAPVATPPPASASTPQSVAAVPAAPTPAPAPKPVAASQPSSPALAVSQPAPAPKPVATPKAVQVAASTPAPAPKPVAAAPQASAAPRTAAPSLRPATAIPGVATQRTAATTHAATAARPAAVRTPAKPAAASPVPAPASAVAAQKSKTVDVAVDPELVDGLDLAEVPNQGQPIQLEGQLRNAPFMAGSPSRYRLLSRSEDGILEMTCHIHGDSEELRQYVGQDVSIRGREYWVEDSDMPVVVVGQIVPLAPASEPVLF